ncbi:MAG TPA: isoprenylcysteine carboxylmethyltransferase family protein [Candidatus Margulisiibacteriota bacterium]|nr:isoprenylcysteine carboxylmethyltransferase family protein [Candidatus Margulisiibacteriota bacterium]
MSLGIALGLAFGLGWIPLFVCRAEAVTEALPSYTPSERWWVTLTPALLAMHMVGVCVAMSLTADVTWAAAAAGVALFGSAIAFWFWGRLMIGPLRVRRLPTEPPLRLQRRGAFGLVRHPLYLGYLLAAAAPLAVVPRPLFVLTFVLSSVALVVRAMQEERRLRAQVGTPYDDYCREVKRLIPFVW